MGPLALIAGLLLALVTLLDGFETILLPRRVNRRFRYSRLYYTSGWRIWRGAALAIPAGPWREGALGVFGPLSMLGLFGSWVASLIVAFALVQWSLGSHLLAGQAAPAGGFPSYLYFSGTTFFTLGLGDLSPVGRLPRVLTVLEGGLGFGFLAIVIGYLPVLYQAFSRREVTISLLDARAGSPASGGEFLARLARAGRIGDADEVLRGWEQWCAELLESHISFPVLAYYRSQHANQSWLAALATMLDGSALLLAFSPARDTFQAQLTFAMARHAAVDIALIFRVRPPVPPAAPASPAAPAPGHDRLDPADGERLRRMFREAGVPDAPEFATRLAELRAMYEPFLLALADHFLLALPPIVAPDHATHAADNWQRSAWMPRPPGIGSLPAPPPPDSTHFD